MQIKKVDMLITDKKTPSQICDEILPIINELNESTDDNARVIADVTDAYARKFFIVFDNNVKKMIGYDTNIIEMTQDSKDIYNYVTNDLTNKVNNNATNITNLSNNLDKQNQKLDNFFKTYENDYSTIRNLANTNQDNIASLKTYTETQINELWKRLSQLQSEINSWEGKIQEIGYQYEKILERGGGMNPKGTWHPGRSMNVNYTNDTGYLMLVVITYGPGWKGGKINVDGVDIARCCSTNSGKSRGTTTSCCAIIPNGSTYSVRGHYWGGSPNIWREFY